MNAIVSDANERQELDTDYVDPEPELEHLRDVIDADGEPLEVEAQVLLDNLPAHRVLFYPLADLDLEPLHRFGHLAVDVLLLCDWRWPNSPDGFNATMSELLDKDRTPGELELFSQDIDGYSFEVPAEQVQAITGVSTDFGLFSEPAWISGQEPWGRITRLRRRSGDVEHPVWVVYIVGNCVEVYQNLFVERGTAPRVLWLDAPLGVDLDGWEKFISPGGEFGSVFSTATPQPKYVAAQRHHPGWKQTIPCQWLSAWHRAWALTVYGLPDSPAV